MHRMILVTALLPVLWAGAHPADISHMRMEVGRSSLRLRFSLNIATLDRLQPLDTDRDGKATLAEIEAAIPEANAFLKSQTLLTLNDTDTDTGTFTRFECLWPDAATTAPLFPEWPGRFVDIIFERRWPEPVRDFWISFQWFERLGVLHTIESVIHQPGQPVLPVPFSVSEPDYLYDATTPTATTEEEVVTLPATEQPSKPMPMAVVGAAVVITGLFVLTYLRRTT
jgi:hypothetical protein